MKNTQGIQPGELPGSLHDAMMQMMPQMKMMPGAMEPGQTPQMMVDAMLQGWRAKYGNMPDIAPYDMSREPTAPPLPAALQTLMNSWPDNDQAKPQYGQITRQAKPDMEQTSTVGVAQQLEAINAVGNANRMDETGKRGVQHPDMPQPMMAMRSDMKH